MKINEIFDVLFLSAQSIENVTANARITCAITYKKDIISFGFNRMKSHPFQKLYGKNEECVYLHSEIDAIKNALRVVSVDDMRKCSLYICRAKKATRIGPFIPGMSLPCIGCMRAITTFNIKKVFYTTENCREFSCI